MSALPSLPPNFEPPDRDGLHQLPPRRTPRWKLVLTWIAGGLIALLLVLVTGVTVLLHSRRFHDYVLQTAQQKITASVGSNVRVQNYTLSFNGISPTFDIYGLVVDGAAPYTKPPVLMVEHIRATLRVVSLFRQTWYIDDIEVHHPVAQLFVDRNGVNNIPQSTSSTTGGTTNVFDLAIRHAVLDQGEVYYNDHKSLMRADLQDVNFHAGFNPLLKKYSGTLSYRNGHLELENFNPIAHDLDAEFSATPQSFSLQRATLRSGRSAVVVTATLNDYAKPAVQANYDATLDTAELRHITKNPSLPVGMLKTSGSLNYGAQPGVPALNQVTVRGELSSRQMLVETTSLRQFVRNIGAKYSLESGNLDVRDIRALLLGGSLAGTLTVRDVSGRAASHLHATLNGAQLASLQSLSKTAQPTKVSIHGQANADADARWDKSFDHLLARANAQLHGNLGPGAGNPVSTGAQAAVPLNGVIHANYSGTAKEVTVANSYIRTPQTALNLNGTVSQHSALQIHLQSSNLHEVETLADLFRVPENGVAPQPLGLYGTANFNGAVTGTTAAPHLTGQLVASNLKLKGSAWKLLRTNIEASPSMASLQNAELDPATRGHVTFQLRTELNNWSFTDASAFQVSLNASQIDVAELAKLAGSQAQASGTLSANVQLHGTQLNPIGKGTADLTQAKIGNEPIQNASLKFNGTGDRVHSTLRVQMPAGVANADVDYFPKQQGYDAKLHADNFHIEQLETVKARNLQIAGVLNIDATGRGTLKDPQLTATVQIPKLQAQNQTLSQLMLRADVANHLARIALDSNVINSRIHGGGTIALTGAYDADLTLDTQQIPFAPLVAIYAPTQAGNLTGSTELHATIRGPLKDKTRLEAHATIPLLNIDYKDTIKIGAPNPIHIDYVNGVLSLQKSRLTGTGTDLTMEGSVPIVDRSASVSLLMIGTMDLGLAQLIDPDITSSGQLRFNINSRGQYASPDVQGQVQIINAAFATPDAPLGLQNGNGTLVLTKDRLNISSFEGVVGGGKVTAAGGVLYRPEVQFDLALNGQGVRLLYPDNVRSGLGMHLTLTGTSDSALLSGTVNVNQLSFTPDFDMMETLGGLSSDTVPPPSQGFTNNLALQVAVRSTNGIDLVNRQLSLQGTANLTVRGTAAQPVVLGRINLTGGDFIFKGNRYKLQGGTVDFVNPSFTEPSMNVSLTTSIQQYNIAMRFEGPVERLRTSYTSDPALPPSDIISLIAFGKTSEASAANPNPPGALGAESLVASGVTGQVTNRVEKIAGISHLSIDPTLGGSQQSPGANVTIQQRVTSKVFVTFSTDVTSTQSQTIQLEYQKSPRLSFSATRDQNGGFAFDTKIRKSW